MLLCRFWPVVFVDFIVDICIRLVSSYEGRGVPLSNRWELVVGGCDNIAGLLLQLPYWATHVHIQHVLAPLNEALFALLLVDWVVWGEVVPQVLIAWHLLIDTLRQHQVFLCGSVRFRVCPGIFLTSVILGVSQLLRSTLIHLLLLLLLVHH